MICTSVRTGNSSEIIASIAKYPFVEIRLDDFQFSETELEQMFKPNGTRKIATCRNNAISDMEKYEIMKRAIVYGADFIDLEIDYCYSNDLIELAKLYKCEIIISEHNFTETPKVEKITDVAELAKHIGADYFKFAAKCNNAKECLTLLKLYTNKKITKIFPKKLISLPIGNEWKSARVTALSLGAPFIYVSSDEGNYTAEGQIKFGDMTTILEIIR